MAHSLATAKLLARPDLLRKYDLSGPRYTSYPTAPQFRDEFSVTDWVHSLAQGNHNKRPLSLYFHIPFCDTVCYYCGCNRIITANKKRATTYVDALIREMDLVVPHLTSDRAVTQMHFGGGTPTFLPEPEMERLIAAINDRFFLDPADHCDYSIEVHPAGVNPERIAHLRELGFNRLSMGVQDFSEQVQKAVNRFNSVEEVDGLVQAARDTGFRSISLDLIYGLPRQTPDSFARSLQHIADIAPDRIALFNYAHMPHLFKTQRQINPAELPEPQEKLQILFNSIRQLCDGGYEFIGMDHFAKPDDELAVAQREKTLHRNFQGYTTHGDCDLVAFGSSSISAIGRSYSQNHKQLDDYYWALKEGALPFCRGTTMNEEDCLRRDVIMSLLCNFELQFADIEQSYGIDFDKYFANELASLKPMCDDGLVEISGNAIAITPTGRLLVRKVCMAFDSYLKSDEKVAAPRYSRII